MQPVVPALTDGWEAPLNQPLCQERWSERRGGVQRGPLQLHHSPPSFEKLLKRRRLPANVIHAGAHDAHCLCSSSSTFRPALHTNPQDPEHSHLTIKTGIRREGTRRKGRKEQSEPDWKNRKTTIWKGWLIKGSSLATEQMKFQDQLISKLAYARQWL